MTTFLLDLWHDLRERRLWPIAVGLLAALVAIPLIMLKPASTPSQPPAVVAGTGQEGALPAVQVDDSPVSGSKLEAFDQRNPFRPLSDLEEDEEGAAASPGGSASGSAPGSAPSGVSSAGGSAGSPSGSGSSSGGAPSGSGGGSTPPGIDPGGPSVQWFRYTADLRFGAPGDTEKMKDVASLTLLPDEKNPAVVFLGVGDDAKSAVFFIADPAFRAEGEGECNSKSDCRFVKLRLDEDSNEHSFIADEAGVQYDVKLLGLNRENLSADEAKGDATDKTKPLAQPARTVEKVTDSFLPRLLYGPGLAAENK